MNRRVNYLILSIFTILLSAGAVYFIYWLGNFSINKKPKNYYKAVFHESVSGLNIASPVKYMGMKIGNVKKITINPDEPDSVIVTFSVDKNIPLRSDSYAFIALEGITGLKYIEIEGGSKNSPILKTSKTNPATIKTIPSFNAKLFETVSKTTDKLNKLLDNLNNALSAEKISHVNKILLHLEKISAYLDKNKYLFEKSIKNFNNLQSNINNTVTEVKKEISKLIKHTVKNERDINQSIQSVSVNTNELIKNLNKRIKDGKFDFKDTINENLKPLNKSNKELQKTLIKLQLLLNQLQNSPSDIIFKKSISPKGPGE